jgi:nucleotide-binding universal stress UspA family protein
MAAINHISRQSGLCELIYVKIQERAMLSRRRRDCARSASALARATGSPITALYISTGESARRAQRKDGSRQPRQRAEAILKEAVEVADRYGVAMRAAVKRSTAIADTILRAAAANRHTLIVMGVNRRPGDALFFGDVAAAILERSARSILFVSGPRAFGAPPETGASKARAGSAAAAAKTA